MSKLIVEMEMPRNCDECDANYDCAYCGITGSEFYYNKNAPDFKPDEQKLPDCPIKGELPDEHGDLIDRDALLRNEQDVCELCNWGYSGELIRKQQAIIAAERKDNEQIH